MADEGEPEKVLDCQGHCCSLPIVEARMELDTLEDRQTLEVVADSVSAEEDMNILTHTQSYELVRKWKCGQPAPFLDKV